MLQNQETPKHTPQLHVQTNYYVPTIHARATSLGQKRQPTQLEIKTFPTNEVKHVVSV
jgi:hypothetical protein